MDHLAEGVIYLVVFYRILFRYFLLLFLLLVKDMLSL